LYVCDWREQAVCKVDLRAVNDPVKWRAPGPRGLFINKECNVIVTCVGADVINEYTATGALVRRVRLQRSAVGLPCHAIELSNGHYAVSHLQPVHGVSVVDREGCVLFTYRNDLESNTYLLHDPCSLAVTSNDCIIVADYWNNRIILHSSLSCARDLRLSRDDQIELGLPFCIHFDESLDRLFVGKDTGLVEIEENAVTALHWFK